MKPVQNSVNEEKTDGLLLQSNLEYSNSNYASASVFDNIRLRMESEDLFDERNQGDLLDSEITQPQRALQISDSHACKQSNASAPQLGSTLPLCLRDIARGHNRIHSTWRLSVIEAMFLTNQISELTRAAV